jgi:hypothetical protein
MKSTLVLTAIAALTLGTTACETKTREVKTVKEVVEAGVKTESVRCFTTTLETVKTDDGSFDYKNDIVTVATKVITTAADGTMTIETKGDVTTTQFSKNEDGTYAEGSSFPYSYSATRTSKDTKLKNGDIQTVASVKTVSIIENEEGVKSEKVKEEKFEEVVRTVNGVTKTISSKINGVDQSVIDDETTETISGNVKTTHTVLKTPYTEMQNGAEFTTHSSEAACTITTTK